MKWRGIDPEGAAEFLESYPNAVRPPIQIAASVTEESVPEDAVENAEPLIRETGENRDQYEHTLANILESWPKGDLPRALDWLAEQGGSEETFEGRSALAARLIQSDPAAAFDLPQPMPEGERLEKVTERVLERWASHSRQDALEFLRDQESTWPEEKLNRLRELALTAQWGMFGRPIVFRTVSPLSRLLL